MKYLHAMAQIKDIDKSLKSFPEDFGLKEIKRMDNENEGIW